uniref:Uncharacterized protein n=1 Tax=Acrobeloides nanus TaxID=290746 RepID=A0A914BX01_9BILA
MRLKLFATPHLCIISALIVNGDLLSLVLSRKVSSFWRSAFAIAVISGMGYQGVKNIQQQLSIAGEYSNPEQEALFNWIQVNTRPEDVFAGSMPVMANLKLSTERPIVNHPHYENEEIRNRTMKVYSLYSRKPIHEVYQTLKSMRVDYYVFQPHNCQPNPRKGCSYIEMWDLVDPTNINKPSLCDIIHDSLQNNNINIIQPFETVYNSRFYVVFKL